MTFQDFQDKHLGKTVDYYHTLVPGAVDLVAQYVYETHSIALPAIQQVRDFWDNPPSELSGTFFKIQENGTNPGDIVVLNDTVGIATGHSTDLTVETLVQNAVVEVVNLDKAMVLGLVRNAESKPLQVTIETPVQSVMESLPKVYKAPSGAIPVPLHRIEFKVVADLWGYNFMSHAQTGTKPVERLKAGKYWLTFQQGGMARIENDKGDRYWWINPADNIVKKFNDAFREDTRHTYKWYGGNNLEESKPIKFKADGDYVKRNKRAEVFSFNPAKENAAIEYQQPVWIAGTFIDGQRLYGIPANQRSDGTFKVMESYGIPLSYLVLEQMDYVPEEELIQDVEPVEAEAFVPEREITMKDRQMMLKGSTQRFIDGFIRPKRKV